MVPQATVELENQDTGLKRTGTTDTGGAYAFLQVAPGNYRLTVKASGFRSATISDVKLLVNNPATVNIKLEVGQVTETVSVTAEAEHLNTIDASIGNAIANKPIQQLPLNARNIVGLLALQPGVVYTRDINTDTPTDDTRSGAVNGGKSDQANVTLDGVDVNDQMDRKAFESVLRMTPDAVQEFRVTTLNANADSGRSSGAQVVLVTKGGTNDLHGSAYWYVRNRIFNANDFFLNSTLAPDATGHAPRPKLNRNIYGASLGGAIKKNRLFYFANWEGRKDLRDGQAVRTIPSMLLRQGIVQYRRTDGTVASISPDTIQSKFSRSVNQTGAGRHEQVPDAQRPDGGRRSEFRGLPLHVADAAALEHLHLAHRLRSRFPEQAHAVSARQPAERQRAEHAPVARSAGQPGDAAQQQGHRGRRDQPAAAEPDQQLPLWPDAPGPGADGRWPRSRL